MFYFFWNTDDTDWTGQIRILDQMVWSSEYIMAYPVLIRQIRVVSVLFFLNTDDTDLTGQIQILDQVVGSPEYIMAYPVLIRQIRVVSVLFFF